MSVNDKNYREPLGEFDLLREQGTKGTQNQRSSIVINELPEPSGLTPGMIAAADKKAAEYKNKQAKAQTK